MNIPYNPPQPLLALTPELRESSEKSAKTNLFQLLSKLSNTIFSQEAPALVSLQDALGDVSTSLSPESSNHEPLDKFFSCVPLTNYEDYQPFIACLLDDKLPRLSDVNNLLSTGLPAYISRSSGTSGGPLKYFLKYLNSGHQGLRWDSPGVPGFKLCSFSLLNLNRLKEVVDDNGDSIQHIPVTIASTGRVRLRLGLGPMDDAKIIDKKANFVTTPFAVWLLPSYQANIFMTTLFALIDPSLSLMESTFSTLIYDAVRILEEHWDAMIDAIQVGALPDIHDLGEYRSHIEAHFKPKPDRAEELRKIEKGQEGWLKRVWPSLTSIHAAFGGMYSTSVPKLQHHFGPTVRLQSVVLAATEGLVGIAYGGNDTNLYYLGPTEHIEFLDVEKEDIPENLVQRWQVEVGKKYEVVMTNNDGLWRYRLNDIVEVAGFTPADGIPLIRYVERKGVGFRLGGEFISESFLRDIMGSLTDDSIGHILEFTTVPDHRKDLRAYGLLVELDGEIGRDPAQALAIVKQKLRTDTAYKNNSEQYLRIGDPTIRILKPGTFREFRHWKAEMIGINSGQIKVPTMLKDPVTIDWLEERVALEV